MESKHQNVVVPLQETRAVSKTLWERLQLDHALNHMCNQSNGRARRHRRGDVVTRKLKRHVRWNRRQLSVIQQVLCVCTVILVCESYWCLSVLISSSCLKPKKRQSIRRKQIALQAVCPSLPSLHHERGCTQSVRGLLAKVGSRGRETLCLSSSEEVDVVSVDEICPLNSPQV